MLSEEANLARCQKNFENLHVKYIEVIQKNRKLEFEIVKLKKENADLRRSLQASEQRTASALRYKLLKTDESPYTGFKT